MKRTFIILSIFSMIFTSCAKDQATPYTPGNISSATDSTTVSVRVSYNNDVRPILADKCATAGCHGSGGEFPNLTTYTNTKTHVSTILYRMNLNQGTSGFMPDSGVKTQSDIDKITQWQSDGLLEK